MKKFLKRCFGKLKRLANTIVSFLNLKNRKQKKPKEKKKKYVGLMESDQKPVGFAYLKVMNHIWKIQDEISQLQTTLEKLKVTIIKEKENLTKEKSKKICCSSKLLDCEQCYNYYRGPCTSCSREDEDVIDRREKLESIHLPEDILDE